MLSRSTLLRSAAAIVAFLASTSVLALPGAHLIRSTAEEVWIEIEVAPAAMRPVEGRDWVEVSVEGYSSLSEAGAPALPTGGLAIALPPGTTPRLEVLEVQEYPPVAGTPAPVPRQRIVEGPEELPSYELEWELDPYAYDGPGRYPSSVASLGDPVWLRHQRIVPVAVTPVLWDRAAGLLRPASRVRLRVEFVRPAGIEGREEEGLRPVPPGGAWERTYRGLILNYEEARHWRRAPAGSLPMRIRIQQAQAKIVVEETGLYRLPYDALVAAGLTEPSLSWDEVVLVDAHFDDADLVDPLKETLIPYLPEDAGGDGRFGPGDALIFFGQDRWERFDQPERDRRYGRDHAYWLRWEGPGQPGAHMEERPSWFGWEGLVPPDSVLMSRTAERDSVYGKPAAEQDNSGSLSSGVEAVRVSHFYWSDPDPGTHWVFFRIPAGARLEELSVELQGRANIPSGNEHIFSLYLSNQPRGARPWFPFPDQPDTAAEKSRVTVTLDASELAGFTPVYEPDSLGMVIEMPTNGYDICVDRIRTRYRRPYLASLGHFAFHTGGLAGQQEFRIRGFESDDIVVVEVTDSLEAAVLPLAPQQIVQGDQGYEVTLQLDAGDGTAARWFLVAERERIRVPASHAVSLRQPADLAGPGTQDYVAIYHPDFESALEPLLQHRESQGHSVLRASVEDVYDVFDGGRKSPVAIRNFLRYLFRTRGEEAPAYVLLVGDGSDDHPNATGMSDENFVPTMTLFSHMHSPDQGRELVASDEWFVDDLQGTGETLDFRPDMHIGRLPVGSLTEAQTVANKIIRYENFQSGDAWRNRAIFFADDQFSSTIDFSQDYLYRSYEDAFERGAKNSIAYIYRDAELFDFEVDSFFVSAYLDTLPSTGRCEKDTSGTGCPACPSTEACRHLPCRRDGQGRITLCARVARPWEWSREQGEDHLVRPGPLADLLHEKLSRGCLFWVVESHANKLLIGHEFVFRHSPNLREDVFEIQNRNSPFLFFGYGCHLAEFSEYREGNPFRRDSISEWLLFHGSPEISLGAVGSVGSTAYESLVDNYFLDNAIFEAFFADPPRIDGESAWIFGDVFTSGKVIMLNAGPGSGVRRGQAQTYTYLGDPALRVDIAPPRLAVAVAGEPVESGTTIAAPDLTDSVRVELRALDEVAVHTLTVEDFGGPLPPEWIEPVPDTTRPGDDRVYSARFTLALRPADYSVIVRAADRWGRERAFTLEVDLKVDFFQASGSENVPLADGDFVGNGGRVIAAVESPVYLEAQRISAELGDIAWSGAAQPQGDGIEGRSRQWIFTSDPISGMSAGEHEFRLLIRHRDENVTVSRVRIRTDAPDQPMCLVHLYAFPNPFEDDTEFHYRLNQDGRRARIRIYTLRGQLIQTLDDLPARINENIVLWNGRDRDGDPVANGVYFYKIRIWDQSGGSISRIERLVRAR